MSVWKTLGSGGVVGRRHRRSRYREGYMWRSISYLDCIDSHGEFDDFVVFRYFILRGTIVSGARLRGKLRGAYLVWQSEEMRRNRPATAYVSEIERRRKSARAVKF